MEKKTILTILLLIIYISLDYGQITPIEKGLQAITTDAIKAQLDFLASDWTEGRKADEKGAYIASDYIASMLQLYGVKPGGDYQQSKGLANNIWANERTYFQNFILLKTVEGDEQMLKVKATDGKMTKITNFTYKVDFVTRPSDPGIEIEAPVVFAGYGYKNDKLKYNDFDKLDVKGKFILRITGFPKIAIESLSTSELGSSSGSLESTLKLMGAIGIIEVNPQSVIVGKPEKRDFTDMSPSENIPCPERASANYSIPGKKTPDNLIRFEVSVKTANELLKGTGIDIDDYIKKLSANESVSIPPMNGKSIYLKTTVKTSQVAVRNVIGVIEGSDPEKVIVIGAHYDHEGSNNGYIWNGADDNGSGTVGVMTLAKSIMATGQKPKKTIIFALWTAEEEGLLGSRYWIQNPTYPLKNVCLNMNCDMISRYTSDDEPKNVTLTYTSSFTGLKDLTITNLQKYDIDLMVDFQPSSDPPGGSDHRAFVSAGIPIMRFMSGHREEYHTPMDQVETVNWDIMEKIIRINFANVWELANTDW